MRWEAFENDEECYLRSEEGENGRWETSESTGRKKKVKPPKSPPPTGGRVVQTPRANLFRQ